jgi:hypothetical protein
MQNNIPNPNIQPGPMRPPMQNNIPNPNMQQRPPAMPSNIPNQNMQQGNMGRPIQSNIPGQNYPPQMNNTLIPLAPKQYPFGNVTIKQNYGTLPDGLSLADVTFSNGYIYKGEFNEIEKKPHGKGELYTNNNQKIYEGDWEKGYAHGYGIMYNPTFRYEGDIRWGHMDGKGKAFYNNNQRYEGDFKNNIRDGKGILYNPDGSIYFGDFRNDNMNGFGIMEYKNDKNYVRYEGEMKNGVREGRGFFTCHNGNMEIGHFVADKIQRPYLIFNQNGSFTLMK